MDTPNVGTYWVRKDNRSYKLTKSPTPVIESDLKVKKRPSQKSPKSKKLQLSR